MERSDNSSLNNQFREAFPASLLFDQQSLALNRFRKRSISKPPLKAAVATMHIL
jgi:hypothetical protein